MVLIIRGERNSGKTSALRVIKKRLKGVDDILFILSYKRIIDGKREYWIYLNSTPLGRGVCIDKNGVSLNEDVFKKLLSVDLSLYRWVVIDEIGWLELERRCFYELFLRVLKMKKNSVVTVRSGIVKDVIDFFGIKDFRIFEVDEVKKLVKLLCR